MKKRLKTMTCLLLAVILCVSVLPFPVMAADAQAQANPEEAAVPAPSASLPPEQDIQEMPEPTPAPAAEPVPTAEPTPEVFGPTWLEAAEPQAAVIPAVEAKPVKTVERPLVQVIYHYYSDTQNSAGSIADHAVTSTHTYYTLAQSSGAGLAIPANHYPGRVPVYTDALHFRVLCGEADITALASYDAETGIVTLPQEYMGHGIEVEWYCPQSEVVELPVRVTMSVYRNGVFSTETKKLNISSNADGISIPLADAGSVTVSQSGVDLDEASYQAGSGVLHLSAPALGGDISVTAYITAIRAMRAAKGNTAQVVHTRSAEQIYYGYYTSYYTANGNTAFCLDPTVSGLNAGTYDVSGWLTRGTGYDDLIKAAYYLYGGPGYDSVKHNLFGEPDSMEAYGLCHAAAAYMWLDNEDAFKGLSAQVKQHLRQVVAAVDAQAMPPEGFEVFLYNVGSQTNQSLMSWEYTPTGSVEIQKVSGDPAKTDGNPCYSLAGAVFGIYTGNGERLGGITTDESGKGRLDGIAAGQSGLYLLEETAPKGYAKHTEKIPFEIVSGQTAAVTVTNHPQGDPVTILLKKQDGNTASNTPQGNADLGGAQFTIRYYQGLYQGADELKGKTPERTWIVETDRDGYAALYYASNGTTPTIPLGTVEIRESKSPEGYLKNDTVFIRQVTADGEMEAVSTYAIPIVPEEVIRGGISVQKRDAEFDRPAQPQGDADLAATLDIYNRSESSVIVNGVSYAPGKIVYTLTTDAKTGAASTSADLLPFGDYELVERPGGQPQGYLNTGKLRQAFSITENGKIVDLKTDAGAIKNDVIRGGVYVEKWDAELGENKAQGGGSLDVTVEIANIGENPVLVGGKEYAPGEVVYTMTLDREGRGSTPDAYYLPYSTYEVRETVVSEGYLATGILTRTFTIRKHGEMVRLDTAATALKNNPIRGDLRGVKISDSDGRRMAGIPFEIRSLTTGEAHIAVTDKNGEFNTASSWNPHSQNTNRGETDRDGIWFGSMDALDDSLGALLYDDYRLTELPCEANADRELLSFDVSVYRHNTTVDLGTLTNDYVQMPEIFTTARDKATDLGSAYVSEETVLLDTVYYSGLTPGREYLAKGTLMDAGTGDATGITAQTPFRALSDNGSVTVEFVFDSTLLAGKSVVVFEELYGADGTLLAEHKDISDEGQTVTFQNPEIRTTATGENEAKQLTVHPKTVIYDVVEYAGLIPGKTYTLQGVLMDREKNAPLTVNGEEIRVEQEFTPEEADGSVTMEFTLDSLTLAGKQAVVFEELYFDGLFIAEHRDISDEGQTVGFLTPMIGTSAAAEDGTKTVAVSETAKAVDTVTYENLSPGQEYLLTGTLIDRETGNPVSINGKELTVSTVFTPESESGSAAVEFVFDSRSLQGKELVVFETLTHNESGTKLAEHADIDDEAQMVSIGVEPPPEEPQSGKGAQTGRSGLPFWMLAVMSGAAAGAVLLVWYLRKQKRKEQ